MGHKVAGVGIEPIPPFRRGGTSPQGPIPQKKNPIKKSRRKKSTGSRSQVPPQRAALKLCTKLGSQTSDPWRGVHVGAGPECRFFRSDWERMGCG